MVLAAAQTLVIPVDPGQPVQTLPGHWVGALPDAAAGAFGRVPVELTTRADPQLPSLPPCPWFKPGSSCSLYFETGPTKNARVSLADFEGSAVAAVEVVAGQAPRWRLVGPTDADTCTCLEVSGLSSDAVMLEDGVEYEDEGYDDDDEAHALEIGLSGCSEEPSADIEPFWYVGGVLYLGGLYNELACDGDDDSYGTGEVLPLRLGARSIDEGSPADMICDTGVFFDPSLVDVPPAEVDDCVHLDQMEMFALYRGRLVFMVGSSEGSDDQCTCAGAWPLTAELCPSALDPCGRGEGLPGRDAWSELWVSTDERLALGQDEEGLAVLGRDGAAIRRVPAPEQILGVELHPDTALVGVELPPQVVRVSLPALHERDASFRGSAQQWGNRCFKHIKAGRLDAAEAACFAGLLVQSSKGTRGALTYNLGRIEEARGDRARARTYYERSQELRPHAATAKRLRELGGS